MAKISKSVVDSTIRSDIFAALNIGNIEGFHKINDRQYGCIVVDANGTRRYARVGVIVAEERDDCTADDLMASEISEYEAKQEEKARKMQEKKEKIAKDKAKREAEKAKRAAEKEKGKEGA